MIGACLGLLAGVYALQLSSFAATSDPGGLALVAFISAILLRRRAWIAWACLGLTLYAIAGSALIESRLDARFAGDSMVMQVRITEFPVRKRETTSFVAEPIDDRRHSGRVRVSWFDPPVEIRLGDIWQLELRLRRPRGNSNPGVFDYEAWLFRSRINATGYVVPGRRNKLVRTSQAGSIDSFRQRFVDRLMRTFPGNENVGVLAAISVGARHLVTTAQWERYAITGTSHLMAISGLHVGLAAGGAYILATIVSILFGHGNHHFRATSAALAIAASYALVTGLAAPSQRATVMIGLAAAAILRRRQPQAMPVITLTCLGLVLLSPVATMAPGFKLSFAAVVVLTWLARRHAHVAPGSVTAVAGQAVWRLACLQVALLFGLLPLTVSIFGRIALAAPPVNLIAVPVFSVLTVPATLGAMVLDGPLQFAGDKLLLVALHSLRGIEFVIELAAGIPAADVVLPAVAGMAWLFLFLTVAWVVLPPAWPGRSIALLGVMALLLYEPSRPPGGCTDIDVLDAGQGLAVFVQTRSSDVLYDTGPGFRNGGSAAETVVLPFLASRGVERLDVLVISHGDLDHSGGIEAIVADLKPRRTYTSEPLDNSKLQFEICRAGQFWKSEQIEFRFLHPPADAFADGNDASCVLMIAAGEHRLLLTGDIERSAESWLVQHRNLPTVDAVVVPHHGSRTSSSLPFVRALSPQLAIVSASFGNRWGFPNKDIVERWSAAGASVLNTASAGAVSLRLCADSGVSRLARNRFAHRRIWSE